MKHLAFLSVLAIVLPLSGLRADPDKAKGNPFAFSNTDSQLLKNLWQIDSNLYSAQLDRYQKAQLCVEKAKLYARQDYYSTGHRTVARHADRHEETIGTLHRNRELMAAPLHRIGFHQSRVQNLVGRHARSIQVEHEKVHPFLFAAQIA